MRDHHRNFCITKVSCAIGNAAPRNPGVPGGKFLYTAKIARNREGSQRSVAILKSSFSECPGLCGKTSIHILILTNSHNTIPAATEMFNECFIPNCGISMEPSQSFNTSSPTPLTSLPNTTASLLYCCGSNS